MTNATLYPVGTATVNCTTKTVELVETMHYHDEIFGDEIVYFTTNLDGTGSYIVTDFKPTN